MKIAVAHKNGEVFQHFGHTEEFKVYEIENQEILSSEVISTEGSGHEALAVFLAEQGIRVVICGGIGSGAQAALDEAGIELCAGAEGNADEAVASYLKGELVNTGVNCDHHGEGHSCGSHEEDGHCGHGCHEEEGESEEAGGCGAGGCGGCHGCRPQPAFEGKNVGKTCKVHYTGTFNDGTKFDSSYDREKPLTFVCGAGMMIRGFDKAVANQEVGSIIDIHLMPEEAYGEADPEAIVTMDLAEIPGAEELTTGQKVYLQDMYGRPIPVTVAAKTDTTITFDANHEMAGKELNFRIELLSVSEE